MNLADLLAREQGVCIPGCYDGFSALLVEQAGFPAAFLSGGSLAMARLGRPDIGLVTAAELIDTVMQITDRIAIPLIVDGDTGFGNALTLQRAIRQLSRAGAAAVTIEDQSFPKRCGHMAGKSVVAVTEAAGRIRAAADAADGMAIIARSDALAIEGLEATLDRAEAYLEAGADMLFVEGPETMAQVDAIAGRFAGRVPFFARGYAATLHPLLLLSALAASGPGLLATLREQGSTESIASRIADLSDMNRLTGAQDLISKGDQYG
jgi:2-methylisocitrate lyase-like PEP mutase family enzyme